MKTYFKTIALAIVVSVLASSCFLPQPILTSAPPQQPIVHSTNEDLYDQTPDINLSVFENELSPYGYWMNYPGYGNVWVCRESGFRPYYSGGHWDYTSYGWTWVSDYRWGWAPFHYGRWSYDAAYGWFWIPGYEWAPAWVSWRSGGGYYGWAPLAPGIDINSDFSFGSMPYEHWNFIENRYMGMPNMNNYYLRNSMNITIFNTTNFIRNSHAYKNHNYMAGPDRFEVERYSGKKINELEIHDARRPQDAGRNDRGLQFYRPNVKRNDGDNRPSYPSNNNNDRNKPANPPQRDNNERDQRQRNDQNRNANYTPQQPNNKPAIIPNNGGNNNNNNNFPINKPQQPQTPSQPDTRPNYGGNNNVPQNKPNQPAPEQPVNRTAVMPNNNSPVINQPQQQKANVEKRDNNQNRQKQKEANKKPADKPVRKD